jgi:hypothetical protein
VTVGVSVSSIGTSILFAPGAFILSRRRRLASTRGVRLV